MTEHSCEEVLVRYGSDNRCAIQVDPQRVVVQQTAPTPLDDIDGVIRDALTNPLGFPPLQQAVVPGDTVVVALDVNTPADDEIIAALWDVFASRDVLPADVLILQPAGTGEIPPADPRRGLPAEIAAEMAWQVHSPDDDSSQKYLATSASGERIYLAREVIEADFVLTVGPVAFDTVLGYRGTCSVLYPGLSSIEAVSRSQGQGHDELEPSDERPLRQLIDEIGWLLGIQFCVQVVPSGGTGAADVLAGCPDAVFRAARERLDNHWMVQLDERPDIVVATIESDAGGHGWEQVGAALAVSRNLVARDGQIIMLTELDELPGDGLDVVRGSDSPDDALQPLRSLAPADLVPATQCAHAVNWARVYLLSHLDGELVEDLFITPLEDQDEVQRLLTRPGRCVILEDAQHAWGRVQIED